jgi:chromosomal replication initiator protein
MWRALKTRLRGEMDPAAFQSWVERLDVREAGGSAIVVAPNRFVADWVRNNMGYQIRTLWAQIDPEGRPVEFGVASPLAPVTPASAASVAMDADAEPEASSETGAETAASAEGAGRPTRASFGRVASFANFIPGPSNEFALSAARAVARGAGPELNPLFIHGAYGFGKSHLMHAIQHEIEREGVRSAVYYSGERFTTEFVEACARRETPAFKARVRGADVLLIDDIQMVEGKKATQEEFFHTVADLVHSGRQVVVTAAVPLAELDGLDDRTRSLLSGGVRCDIGPADLDLRRRILDRVLVDLHTRHSWLDMPADARGFLAARVTASPRELLGALNTLIARAAVHKRRMTIDWVTEVLTRHVAPEQKRVSVDQIQKAVAQYFDLRVTELLSRRRTRAIAVPRQIAMYLAKELTTRSYPDLARRFGGRDHTTVIHGVRRIASLMEADAGMAETVASIRRMLEN